MTPPASALVRSPGDDTVDPAAAALLAARLARLAERLEWAAVELAAADPAASGRWRGPASAAFDAARSCAHERLVAAADAAGAAAAMAARAAELAASAA